MFMNTPRVPNKIYLVNQLEEVVRDKKLFQKLRKILKEKLLPL